jgi:hypothetical protein
VLDMAVVAGSFRRHLIFKLDPVGPGVLQFPDHPGHVDRITEPHIAINDQRQ